MFSISGWICRGIKLPTLGIPQLSRTDLRNYYRLTSSRSCGQNAKFVFSLMSTTPGLGLGLGLGLPQRVKLTCTPGTEWLKLRETLDRLG